MYTRIIFLAVLFLFGWSCRKDSFSDEPLQIQMTLNDSFFSFEYPPGPMGNSYGFSTNVHYANGYGVTFPIDPMRYVTITFGQLTSKEPQVTYEKFKSLFVRGEKTYDSIRMAFNQVKTDRVEVDYRDEHGKRWSSTHLLYDNTGYSHKVQQPGSSFMVQDVEELNINGLQGFKFRGYFHCILYEENGNRTKQLKVDEFVALVTK